VSKTLYIVATPIGNLQDITLRALQTLKSADLILCEDTRVSRKLLMHYEIDTPTLSYHQHSPPGKKEEIVDHLAAGGDLALVTDAGTPGISDPGNELIDYLKDKIPDMKVIPIPGASALTTALSASGFKTNKFIFLGFMPKKGKTKMFKWIREGKINFAFYESPFRIIKTLNEIKGTFGEVRVSIARELTKVYEEILRGNVSEVIEELSAKPVKGEIVVVVEIE
jgi:16S rRNA (cytidine1402-2'-O)-methyltransferase